EQRRPCAVYSPGFTAHPQHPRWSGKRPAASETVKSRGAPPKSRPAGAGSVELCRVVDVEGVEQLDHLLAMRLVQARNQLAHDLPGRDLGLRQVPLGG